jgi:Uma2 family endonuclease
MVEQREQQEGAAREIIAGEWAKENEMAGQLHGLIGGRLYFTLYLFVSNHQLGQVYPDNTSYILEGTPQNIRIHRIPDLSFVREERVNRQNMGPMLFAPDIAIEVLSPTEREGETAGKIADYLRFGSQQVWVIDPEERSLAVHFPTGRVRVYQGEDVLPGGDLLPGFELRIADLFA